MTQQIENTMPNAKKTTPASSYKVFLRALKKHAWPIEVLTGEADRPEKLKAMIELMGDKKYEEWLIRAFDNDHVDQATGEVLWSERKSKVTPSPENGEPKKAGTGSDVLPPPPAPLVAKTHEQIQTLVDEMVWQKGANVLQRSDVAEILKEYGLKREEITERMVDRADQTARTRVKKNCVEANTKTKFRGKVIWEGDAELDPELNPDHPIRGAAAVRREMEEREKSATRERLNGLRKKNENSDNGEVESRIINEEDDTFTFNGENEMKLSEKVARSMLNAAGVEAKTWGAKKLSAFLNDQERLVEVTEPEDEKQKERFNTILKAVADGKKITVTQAQAQAVGTNGTGSKKEGKKSGTSRKKKDGMSCVDAIYKVLSETKKEMTAVELVEAMAKNGYWSSPGGKTPEATVASNIYVEISKKGKESRFVKVGRGTFAAKV